MLMPNFVQNFTFILIVSRATCEIVRQRAKHSATFFLFDLHLFYLPIFYKWIFQLIFIHFIEILRVRGNWKIGGKSE